MYDKTSMKGDRLPVAGSRLSGWLAVATLILLSWPATSFSAFEPLSAMAAQAHVLEAQQETLLVPVVAVRFLSGDRSSLFPALHGKLVTTDSAALGPAHGTAEAQDIDIPSHHRCSEGGCSSLGCCLVFEHNWQMELLPPSIARVAPRLASVTEFILPADTRPPIPAV